jgi:hypothetical protein
MLTISRIYVWKLDGHVTRALRPDIVTCLAMTHETFDVHGARKHVVSRKYKDVPMLTDRIFLMNSTSRVLIDISGS